MIVLLVVLVLPVAVPMGTVSSRNFPSNFWQILVPANKDYRA